MQGFNFEIKKPKLTKKNKKFQYNLIYISKLFGVNTICHINSPMFLSPCSVAVPIIRPLESTYRGLRETWFY